MILLQDLDDPKCTGMHSEERTVARAKFAVRAIIFEFILFERKIRRTETRPLIYRLVIIIIIMNLYTPIVAPNLEY